MLHVTYNICINKKKSSKGVKMAKKTVQLSSLTLEIQKPVLSNDNILIKGNFNDLAKKIRSMVERYKGEILTDDNVKYIQQLKSQFVSLRTNIERERKEYRKAYLDPPVKLINAMCDELVQIIAEGESALGAQLDAYDQKRKDELTHVLTEYIEDKSKKLREEFKKNIELKKQYYNKTQAEEDTLSDIDRQIEQATRLQQEHDAAVLLIEEECTAAGFLPDTYIRQLDFQPLTEILSNIKKDRKTKDENQKIEIGEKPTEDEIKAMSGLEEIRTRTIRIKYRQSQIKTIVSFLRDNDIEFDIIGE